MKIVINTCYGCFSLSNEAFELYLTLKGVKFYKCANKFGAILGFDYYTCPIEEYEKYEEEAKKLGNYKELSDKNLFFQTGLSSEMISH